MENYPMFFNGKAEGNIDKLLNAYRMKRFSKCDTIL